MVYTWTYPLERIVFQGPGGNMAMRGMFPIAVALTAVAAFAQDVVQQRFVVNTRNHASLDLAA